MLYPIPDNILNSLFSHMLKLDSNFESVLLLQQGFDIGDVAQFLLGIVAFGILVNCFIIIWERSLDDFVKSEQGQDVIHTFANFYKQNKSLLDKNFPDKKQVFEAISKMDKTLNLNKQELAQVDTTHSLLIDNITKIPPFLEQSFIYYLILVILSLVILILLLKNY